MKSLLPILLLVFSLGVEAGELDDASAAYDRGNYETAIRLWLPYAEAGAPIAQHNIGQSYGKLKRYTEACVWWRKAMVQGHGVSAYQLMVASIKGKGLPKSRIAEYAYGSIAKAFGDEGGRTFMQNLEHSYSEYEKNKGQKMAEKIWVEIFTNNLDSMDEWVFPRSGYNLPPLEKLKGYGKFDFGIGIEDAMDLEPSLELTSCANGKEKQRCGLLKSSILDEEVVVNLVFADGKTLSKVELIFIRITEGIKEGSNACANTWVVVAKGLIKKYSLPTAFKSGIFGGLKWQSTAGGQLQALRWCETDDQGNVSVSYSQTLGF